jgi:hypothetical protein
VVFVHRSVKCGELLFMLKCNLLVPIIEKLLLKKLVWICKGVLVFWQR